MRSFHGSGVASSDSSLQVGIHIAKGGFFLHVGQIQFNSSGTAWRKVTFFSINVLNCLFEQFLGAVLE